MSELIEEQFDSQEFASGTDGLTLRRVYHVYVESPVEAADLGPQLGEQFVGDEDEGSGLAYNLFVDSIATKPLPARNCIELTAFYKSPSGSSPQQNKEVWQTEASGETVRIEAVDSLADRPDARVYVDDLPRFRADIGLSIGKKQDGTIDGVDALVPTVSVTCTTWLAVADVTDEYKREIYALIGFVNNSDFREWAAGEVRFDGVSIRETAGERLTELVFRFSCRTNQVDLPFTIVPTINAVGDYRPDIEKEVDKEGWQYLWKQLGDVASYNGVGQPPAQRKGATIAIVVDTIYRPADFSALNIGV
jgi:hypothetical protein